MSRCDFCSKPIEEFITVLFNWGFECETYDICFECNDDYKLICEGVEA